MSETNMAESSMKRRKSKAEEENDGRDTATHINRISDLPDSLLCHILTYLPTRTSVATMKLMSRRWSNLWKHLQVFDFFHDFRNRERLERFKFFVNSVLALRRSHDIRKLHVQINGPMSNHHEARYIRVEEEWILAATGPCLEDPCLYIDWYDRIILPPSFLISCTNLVSLR
ncbi:FBD-associated F-box protein [Trifolium repens]|nr:FBD-associated F-box protein [Trifolium repens]